MEKRVFFPLFCMFLVSCGRNVSVHQIELENSEVRHLDICSMSPLDTVYAMNLFLFQDYIITVVPQSNIGRVPYQIYNKNLEYVCSAGYFGHSKDEMLDVNPLYIGKTDSSFFQCIDGYYESEFFLSDKELQHGKRRKLSHLEMNNLCRINDSLIVFDNLHGKKEFVLYDTYGQREIKKFSTQPIRASVSGNYGGYFENEFLRDFYDKTVVYNGMSNEFCSLYLNIPLIRIFNDKGQEKKAFSIHVVRKNKDQYIEEFENGENTIFFTQARKYKGLLCALYHGVKYSEPQSEIQFWNSRDGLQTRLQTNYWIECFDIDEKEDSLYGILSKDGNQYLFKAHI